MDKITTILPSSCQLPYSDDDVESISTISDERQDIQITWWNLLKEKATQENCKQITIALQQVSKEPTAYTDSSAFLKHCETYLNEYKILQNKKSERILVCKYYLSYSNGKIVNNCRICEKETNTIKNHMNITNLIAHLTNEHLELINNLSHSKASIIKLSDEIDAQIPKHKVVLTPEYTYTPVNTPAYDNNISEHTYIYDKLSEINFDQEFEMSTTPEILLDIDRKKEEIDRKIQELRNGQKEQTLVTDSVSKNVEEYNPTKIPITTTDVKISEQKDNQTSKLIEPINKKKKNKLSTFRRLKDLEPKKKKKEIKAKDKDKRQNEKENEHAFLKALNTLPDLDFPKTPKVVKSKSDKLVPIDSDPKTQIDISSTICTNLSQNELSDLLENNIFCTQAPISPFSDKQTKSYQIVGHKKISNCQENLDQNKLDENQDKLTQETIETFTSVNNEFVEIPNNDILRTSMNIANISTYDTIVTDQGNQNLIDPSIGTKICSTKPVTFSIGNAKPIAIDSGHESTNHEPNKYINEPGHGSNKVHTDKLDKSVFALVTDNKQQKQKQKRKYVRRTEEQKQTDKNKVPKKRGRPRKNLECLTPEERMKYEAIQERNHRAYLNRIKSKNMSSQDKQTSKPNPELLPSTSNFNSDNSDHTIKTFSHDNKKVACSTTNTEIHESSLGNKLKRNKKNDETTDTSLMSDTDGPQQLHLKEQKTEKRKKKYKKRKNSKVQNMDSSDSETEEKHQRKKFFRKSNKKQQEIRENMLWSSELTVHIDAESENKKVEKTAEIISEYVKAMKGKERSDILKQNKKEGKTKKNDPNSCHLHSIVAKRDAYMKYYTKGQRGKYKYKKMMEYIIIAIPQTKAYQKKNCNKGEKRKVQKN
nr:histone-lysine N-methyltransferase, H3 lysine-79 specific-like [Cherax quadricarinatus]